MSNLTSPAQLPGAAALKLLEWISQQDGKMINGNRLSSEAKAALADLQLALAAAAPAPAAEGFYIACFKRRNGLVQWWRPEFAGYTPYLEQAGIYTAAQLQEKGDYLDNEYTVPVPVAFVAPHITPWSTRG